MKGGGGRGGRMCQDQSIVHAGLLLLPSRRFSAATSLSPSLPPSLSCRRFFSSVGTAVFLTAAFLRPFERLPPTPNQARFPARARGARVYFTPVTHTPLLFISRLGRITDRLGSAAIQSSYQYALDERYVRSGARQQQLPRIARECRFRVANSVRVQAVTSSEMQRGPGLSRLLARGHRQVRFVFRCAVWFPGRRS